MRPKSNICRGGGGGVTGGGGGNFGTGVLASFLKPTPII